MQADLFRATGRLGAGALLGAFFGHAGFKYCALMRTCTFLHSRKSLRYTLYPVARLVMKQFSYRYGIQIPPQMDIGPGLFIGHVGGIVVNGRTKIGKNCNLSQNVTIGQTNRGAKQGCPVIGDNVYIGPGAVIVGRVRVGNNVAIGANCVVTKDVPDNAVVVGIPGRVISDEGSAGYVNRTEYEARLFPDAQAQ
ncbi:serine O-acetyltransferase [Truepera radiovictrix]|uniref:Serine acetyltransferase n=1 Tax=Truepera radiovictrix (strain DSM 17093 / CIP 108686 / LMG 22925 / RQ-24) TaxID=649638 RepID=D7CQK0_TRURR|nr:serine O-acetyltransferase [Truepera radiovictrix]ADI14984.1 transferase hexapeptide repeat containing protein [Truepera radiovictrix DSM 17093]WMT56461.1 serine O-acetyltransferase [Truepera radiovictrix]